MTIYDAAWFFLIYALLGWCVEVAYAAVNVGKFINRGFLNGPWCPIYGFGAVGVIWLLTPVRDQLLLLFAGSVLLTTTIEFIAGFALEKLFHMRWWDYTTQPFNIGGYICPKFSLLWGMACVIVVDGLHPWVERFTSWIAHTPGLVIVCIWGTVLLVDFIVTLTDVLRIRARITALRRLTDELHKLSDSMGAHISDGVLDVMESGEKLQLHASEGAFRAQEAIEEGRQRTQEAIESGMRRLENERQELEDYVHGETLAARERMDAIRDRMRREQALIPRLARRRLTRAYPQLALLIDDLSDLFKNEDEK